MNARVDAQWNWRPAYDAVNGGRNGLERAAERTLAVAQRGVPVRTGALRASGSVSRDGSHAFVSYGVPYAHVVHERLDAQHARGHAKWLELALLETGPRVPQDVAGGIRL